MDISDLLIGLNLKSTPDIVDGFYVNSDGESVDCHDDEKNFLKKAAILIYENIKKNNPNGITFNYIASIEFFLEDLQHEDVLIERKRILIESLIDIFKILIIKNNRINIIEDYI